VKRSWSGRVRGITSENRLRASMPSADGGGMLTEQQRAEFGERGIVWLRGAFGRRPARPSGGGLI
jgi:hypothetical protein